MEVLVIVHENMRTAHAIAGDNGILGMRMMSMSMSACEVTIVRNAGTGLTLNRSGSIVTGALDELIGVDAP